jgi:hypothetical protein
MPNRREVLRGGAALPAALAAATLIPEALRAQAFPARTITIVAPFPEGGIAKARGKTKDESPDNRLLTSRSRLMPEWMATEILALLLALAGAFAAHHTMLTLGII